VPNRAIDFGSLSIAAGSDAFSLRDRPHHRSAGQLPKTRDYVNRRTVIDYATYVRYRKKLMHHASSGEAIPCWW
jgi:hypothetical protein